MRKWYERSACEISVLLVSLLLRVATTSRPARREEQLLFGGSAVLHSTGCIPALRFSLLYFIEMGTSVALSSSSNPELLLQPKGCIGFISFSIVASFRLTADPFLLPFPSPNSVQGAAISSTLSMGVVYCVCNAAGSLCNACLGGTAAGSTGRKRSVLLLSLAIALALWMQYSLGPSIVAREGYGWKLYSWLPGLGKAVYSAWHDPCQNYDADPILLAQCAGNAGVYRPTAVATLFFAISAVATRVQPSLNKQVWPAKYGIFLTVVAVSVFFSSAPWFTGIYLWIARLGATAFLLLQQVILIDLAYNWNEDWVDRADRADRFDYGSGQAWLHFIVGTCGTFYVVSLGAIVALYRHFDACPENTWIITLSLLGILAFTGIQLSGTEGSLLTSSIVSVYVTYLAYSMVSKNPSGSCNPSLGSNDAWGIAIGLTLTAVSLAWLGWSWTAEDRLSTDAVQSARPVGSSTSHHPSNGGEVNLDVPFLDPDDLPTSGLVMDRDGTSGNGRSGVSSDVWKLNVVMALISCFVAMTLTGWGNLEQLDEHANAANPTVGRVNMAMIGIGQWTCILLYIWTLLAPRLFPDRDFS